MLTRGAAGIDWRAPALQEELAAEWPRLRIEVQASLDSTSTRLLERCRAHEAGHFDAQLLVAEAQLQGRGRLGRSWVSAPGASLTFSLALPLHRADLSGLSLAVGVALAEALDPAARGCAPRLLLKWPNDLWLRGAADDAFPVGRKLGGVLIETVNRGGLCLAVIGVGLNVQALSVEAPSSGVAWLQEIDPHLTAPQTLQRITPPLLRALRQFQAEGFGAFEARFAARDLLLGRDVVAGALQGVAQGVAANGGLRVRCGTGADERLHQIVSGEVSVRLNLAPQPSSGSVAAPSAPLAAC